MGNRGQARKRPRFPASSRGALVCVGFAIAGSGCYCSHERNDERDAYVARDASRDADRPIDAFVPSIDAGPACSIDAPNSAVTGTTPLGEIRFEYGYAGRGNVTHACFEVAIHASDQRETYPWMPPRNQLWAWIPQFTPTIGTHENVTFTLTLGDRQAMTSAGVVEIFEYSVAPDASPAISARIRIEDAGWNVEGSITADYCLTFSDPCL
jgi:hypothetical protein